LKALDRGNVVNGYPVVAALNFKAVSEHLFADNGFAFRAQWKKTRRTEMKHVKKVSVAKVLPAKADVWDDIGDWFHDISGDDKKD
jgi:hypothetical protein